MTEPDDPDVYFSLPESDPVELKIRRSRFIARSFPATDEATVRSHLSRLSKAEHKANHHCWAARFNGGEERFSDDGEPSGTAGMPLLQQLRGHDFLDSLLVVTRYFGGIKLGTGGLVRAYSDSAALLLEQNTPVEHIRTAELWLHCSWEHKQNLYHLLQQFDGKVVGNSSTSDIRLQVRVRLSRIDSLREKLTTALRGQISFDQSGAEA